MKRIHYVSRFARPLSNRDLADIHDSAVRNNQREGVTGFLVCLGNTFFQVLEGPASKVDELYNGRILPDPRHKDVICLKSETKVKARMYPKWYMKAFNLNQETEILPFAFRQMLTALLESSHTIAQYTQPSIYRMLELGVNPTTVEPRRKRVTVLFSDIIGFSQFAEYLRPVELIALVNSHAEVCTDCVSRNGGEVNKLLGDGVLAYFSNSSTDDAIKCAIELVTEMKSRRERARVSSPHRLLYGGVGLANGWVYEGNIGPALKRDFTILGNTVNLASRLESLTRDLGVRLTLGASVMRRASESGAGAFVSLGKQRLKGQSRAIEIFTVRSLPRLDVGKVYSDIEGFVECLQKPGNHSNS